MGVFLQTAILKGTNRAEFQSILPQIAAEHPEMAIDPDNYRYLTYADGIGVLFSDGVVGYEPLAQALSQRLACVAMLLYAYDGDLWGYYLYEHGREVDCFCPMPEYFTDDAGQGEKLQGNAALVGAQFGINPKAIEAYYVRWTEDLAESGKKAHPSDRFPYGDCWQLVDFMERLGYPFAYDGVTNTGAKEPPKLPTLGEILVQKLPPCPPKNSEIYYTVGNLPTALEYEHIAQLLQNPAYPFFADLPAKQIPSVANCVRNEIDKNPRHRDPVLYTLLAFCDQWLGNLTDRYWNLYRAVEGAPDDILLLRARGLVATIHTKRHMGVKDMTKLLELDPSNSQVYFLCRSFFCFINDKQDMACADMQEVLRGGLQIETDKRICKNGFTAEFWQFAAQMKQGIAPPPKLSFMDKMRQEYADRKAERQKHNGGKS